MTGEYCAYPGQTTVAPVNFPMLFGQMPSKKIDFGAIKEIPILEGNLIMKDLTAFVYDPVCGVAKSQPAGLRLPNEFGRGFVQAGTAGTAATRSGRLHRSRRRGAVVDH
jgi:hypothetical protein